MKKAFDLKAVVSLLADGNREINDNYYRCYYLCIYPCINDLFNLIKGIRGLLREVNTIIGAKINVIANSLIMAGEIQKFTVKRNVCLRLIAENNHANFNLY